MVVKAKEGTELEREVKLLLDKGIENFRTSIEFAEQVYGVPIYNLKFSCCFGTSYMFQLNRATPEKGYDKSNLTKWTKINLDGTLSINRRYKNGRQYAEQWNKLELRNGIYPKNLLQYGIKFAEEKPPFRYTNWQVANVKDHGYCIVAHEWCFSELTDEAKEMIEILKI